jgi:formamidopyrimidine-DNA glycosylase
MPELPEVESARSLVEEHCLGATVTEVAFGCTEAGAYTRSLQSST